MFLPSTGFNETEFLLISNEIKKAGYNLFIVSDANSLCIGSNGQKIKNDISLVNANHNNFAGLVIIGGSGIKQYWDNHILHSLSSKFYDAGKLISAICSAPIIFAKVGIKFEKGVCYPADKSIFESYGIEFIDNSVVVSKNVITGKDSASSKEFADTVINFLRKKL
ncbi:MAG: DJ-1/PfpI family protein [Melioribacteraceae bacterium]|nr:DJ-1/PfpI family protein [Melioribacteraceae bacterium]